MRETGEARASRSRVGRARTLAVAAALAAYVLGVAVLPPSAPAHRALAQQPTPALVTPQRVLLPVGVRVTTIPGLMVGDATIDGNVTMADAMYIMQARACIRDMDSDQLRCADTNADGTVSMADAMHVMQFRADPDGTAGILYQPLYDPDFHYRMIDPLAWS